MKKKTKKKKMELCALVRSGRRRCQTVGMEDANQRGKLRKYQCCPVFSKKKSKKGVAKGAALAVDDDDDDNDEYVDDSDILDDDDDDNDDDDHLDPRLDNDQNGPQHHQPPCTVIESNEYLDDDDFADDDDYVPDAPGITRAL